MNERGARLPMRRAGVELRDDGIRTSSLITTTGETFLLNPSARAIWELCDGTTTVEELVAAICEVFEVPWATAREDVERVLAEFEAASLVR